MNFYSPLLHQSRSTLFSIKTLLCINISVLDIVVLGKFPTGLNNTNTPFIIVLVASCRYVTSADADMHFFNVN